MTPNKSMKVRRELRRWNFRCATLHFSPLCGRWASQIKPQMKLTLLTILIAISQIVYAAEVHKKIDKNGNITFSDKSSSDSEKIEVNIDNVYPSTGEVAEKSIGSKLLITVTSNADTRSIVRDAGTISFNNNKTYVLTGFLYSLKNYLEEYENITLSYRAEDIPYAEVDDYHNVTLSQLLSDIDKKNMIKIKQSASDIIILRDW